MKISAGLLVYRRGDERLEVLLTHPGGPFWAGKDTWSIPKGEVESGETKQDAMKREFCEETGFEVPVGELLNLGQAKQGKDKINYIWAVAGDTDLSRFKCRSTFTLEWPPKSNKLLEFPENDRAAWFSIEMAKEKLFKYQIVFVDRLADTFVI